MKSSEFGNILDGLRSDGNKDYAKYRAEVEKELKEKNISFVLFNPRTETKKLLHI